ncbi:hypothetical protein WOLCODRAFT_23503 [Wolfiporia cocos MD-104 SS10]|uniref:Uncharacterized protein n=1 Tax=Wolfiporia cocos (strain MD-104) TaxID=742152 RepID=A0A2H3J8X6_WOLCO|nr:hypothetical protein WOLCODRAFT_23503 [Wolfiporia cocos MD-104 SS10]
MSTAALMESYDTQMLDLGDPDVSMYSSVPEHWLPTEANMIDEDLHLTQEQQSVEVDMEDHDEEITEYEMTDEAQMDSQVDAELLDVDFVDASRVASPHVPEVLLIDDPRYAHSDVQLHGDGSHVYYQHTEPMGPDASYTSFAPHDVPSDSHEGAVYIEHVPQEPSPHELSAPPVEGSVAELPFTSGPSFEEIPDGAQYAQPETAPDEGTAEAPSSTELVQPAPADEGQLASSLGEAVHEVHEHEFHEPAVHEPGGQLEHTTGAAEHADASADAAAALEVPSSISAPQEETREVSGVDQHDGNASAHQPSDPATASTDDAPEAAAPEGEAEAVHDPLEISEGVYIDPPPPVLLTMGASDPIECTLFNQPKPSTPRSPSTSTADAPQLHLLLHHRPTLYYEPLSTVFEALRSEELVQNLPDLEHGELMLDAYDLQLQITEDNVHARQITLHELEILHDGVDMSGPLRLALRVVTPRFISRYYALQEQIIRLNLTSEWDESQLVEDGEQGVDVPDTEDQAESLDPTPVEQPRQDEEGDPETGHETTDVQQQEEAPGDVLHSGSAPNDEVQETVGAHETDETGEAAAAGEEAEAEEGGEEATGDNEGALDADQVHQQDDADTGANDSFPGFHTFAEADFGEDFLAEIGYTPGPTAQDFPALLHDPTEVDEDGNPVHQNTLADLEAPATGNEEYDYLDADAEGEDDPGYDDAPYDAVAGETEYADASSTVRENEGYENQLSETIDELAEHEDGLNTAPVGSVVAGVDDTFPVLDKDLHSSPDEVEELDEWDGSPTAGNAEHEASKTSVTSASSRSSKRGHDEVDSDGEEDTLYEDGHPPTPDSKRARVQ